MNALIFGKRRQGKSTLALRLALTYHHTVFIWDPNNQYQIAGLPVVDTLDDLQEWVSNPDIDHGVLIYRPSAGADDRETEFTELVEIIWKYGNYALIVDEASTVQKHNYLHPELERLIRQAPRDGARDGRGQVIDVSVIQTLHRPVDAHSVCRALASDQFFFRTTLPRDLVVVKEQFGEDLSNQLTALPRWHMIHTWTDPDGRERHATWNNPAAWELRISRHPSTGGS